MFMKKTIIGIGTALAIFALAAVPISNSSRAQTPSNPAPYNVDIGAVITNSLRTAGVVSSSLQANTNWRGVICKLVETVSSGTPSTTFAIQAYDAASASYTTLATSGAVTGNNSGTGATIMIYPSAVMTTTPTGWVLNAVSLPRSWRVTQTVGSGSGANGPATTSKIGCNYLL